MRLIDVETSLIKYQGKHARFRVAMVLPKDSETWKIYFCNINVSRNPFNTGSNIFYDKNRVLIADFETHAHSVHELILKLIHTQSTLRHQPYQFWYGPVTKRLTESRVSQVNKYTFYYNDYSQIGIRGPSDEIRISLVPEINPDVINLPDHRTFNHAIEEFLNIDLRRSNGFQNTISIFLEKDMGRITSFKCEDDGVHVSLDFPDEETEKYRPIVFFDYPDGELERKVIKIEPGRKSYFCESRKYYSRAEVRLLMGDDIIDKAFYYFEEGSMERDIHSFSDDIIKHKELVRTFKDKINVPENVQFGSEVDIKLEKSLKKEDPEDAISCMAEAMDFLCMDTCKVLGIDVGDKSQSFKMHDKIIDTWVKKTGKNIAILQNQTGIRHIFRINDNKKHHGYYPTKEEAEYLFLLVWRGYSEILKMIHDIQNIKQEAQN